MNTYKECQQHANMLRILLKERGACLDLDPQYVSHALKHVNLWEKIQQASFSFCQNVAKLKFKDVFRWELP